MLESSSGGRQGGTCSLFTLSMNTDSRSWSLQVSFYRTTMFCSSWTTQLFLPCLEKACRQNLLLWNNVAFSITWKWMRAKQNSLKSVQIKSCPSIDHKDCVRIVHQTNRPTCISWFLNNECFHCDQAKLHVQTKMSSHQEFSSFVFHNHRDPFHVKCKVWDAALNRAITYSHDEFRPEMNPIGVLVYLERTAWSLHPDSQWSVYGWIWHHPTWNIHHQQTDWILAKTKSPAPLWRKPSAVYHEHHKALFHGQVHC